MGRGATRTPAAEAEGPVAASFARYAASRDAPTLRRAGLDVSVREAGPYMTRETYPADPVDALSALYRDGGLTIAEGRPAVPVPVGRAVGGTTVINSGTALRAPERVLEGWRGEHGVEWATGLEADFADAEKELRVAPVDVESMGRNGQLLMEGAMAIGASGAPLLRNAGRCVQCSSCPKGCRLDAKRAMHVTYLPRAVAAGARVRAGVEAERVLLEGSRATGVACRVNGEGEGRSYEVRADTVVCAGGAFGTPEPVSYTHLRAHETKANLVCR